MGLLKRQRGRQRGSSKQRNAQSQRRRVLGKVLGLAVMSLQPDGGQRPMVMDVRRTIERCAEVWRTTRGLRRRTEDPEVPTPGCGGYAPCDVQWTM